VFHGLGKDTRKGIAMIQHRKWYLLALPLALAACPGSESKNASSGTTDTLTQRQRDSILATSRIPGAPGVGAAMRAADATTAKVRAGDSVAP